jgi:hypothetical protein
MDITVCTSAPAFLFESEVGPPLVVRPLVCDVGLVQRDALVIDEEGTVARWREFHRGQPRRVESEARWLRESGARLVIGDVPPLAFEAAYQAGEKPVKATVVESILSKQIDDLEPKLTRNGYSIKSLAEQFGAKPTEIRAMFRGQLEPARMRELQDQMLAAGLPL